jgi:hypothetical protein
LAILLGLPHTQDNKIGAAGAQLLEQAIRFENTSLVSLNLHGNPCLETAPATVRAIQRYLMRNKALSSGETSATRAADSWQSSHLSVGHC